MKTRSSRKTQLALFGVAILLALASRQAASDAGATFSVGAVRGFPGATVYVPVTLRTDTNLPPSVVALQADVLFDAADLSSAPAVPGAGLTANHIVASSQPASVVLRLLIHSLNT